MDPLSITASALTLVGACRKLIAGFKWVKGLSNIPAEIAAVSEELSDLQHVLTAVGIVTTNRTDDIYEILLSPLFEKVDRILEELCGICGACSTRLKHDANYAETLKVELLARVKWTHERGRVAGLRERLKVLRLDFANQLAAISLLDLAQLKSDLKSVSAQSMHVEVASTRIVDVGVDQLPNNEDEANSRDVQARTSPASALTARMLVKQESASKDYDVLQVIKACSCACHTMTRIKTPDTLQKAFGSLLIKSNGLYGTPACNEFSCRCRISAKIQLSYRFPPWLLGRLLSSVLFSNRLQGPQLSLVMPRIVSCDSEIFYHARSGNIKGIMNLFEKGLAAPTDVNDTWGYSALHYAVDRGHIDLCKFLLNAGARLEVQDQDEHSATDLAWNQICLKKIPPTKAAAFEDMFTKDLWFEARQFTILHKIVLNLLPTPRDLTQELSDSTRMIDVGDSEGRTPLSWAAELGNVQAVETLLEYGASTSTKTVTSMTPLHFAARGPNSKSMAILLDHGAVANARNKWGQGALSIAAYFQIEPSFSRLLLDHGADVNEKDCYGSAPIHCTFTNKFHVASYLLSRGADINERDNYGTTPLCDAIESNSHECISLLLDNGVDLSRMDVDGDTVLHHLARRADLITLQIFVNFDFEATSGDSVIINPDVVNSGGFTAKDVMLTQRLDKTRELDMAFQQLLCALDPWSNTAVFHDTLEEPCVEVCGGAR